MMMSVLSVNMIVLRSDLALFIFGFALYFLVG